MVEHEMQQIGLRELRQNASTYIDLVWTKGVTIEVTSRGTPAARIVPIAQPAESDPIADLVAAGIIEDDETVEDLLAITPLPAISGTPLSADIIMEREESLS